MGLSGSRARTQPLDTLQGGAAPPDQGQLGRRRALAGASRPLRQLAFLLASLGPLPSKSSSLPTHMSETNTGSSFPQFPAGQLNQRPRCPQAEERVRRPREKPMARGTKEGRAMFLVKHRRVGGRQAWGREGTVV